MRLPFTLINICSTFILFSVLVVFISAIGFPCPLFMAMHKIEVRVLVFASWAWGSGLPGDHEKKQLTPLCYG